MKILITGGTSATALKLLKAFSNAEVVFGDYGSVPGMKTDLYRFESLGEFNEDTLAHNLLNNCLNLGVDTILPLRRDEIEAVAKSAVLFSEFDIHVLLPEANEIQFFLSQEMVKTENWMIVKNGELLFSSNADENVLPTVLCGAFYFNQSNFRLVTV
ncbi:MAG: hypothetical protein EOO47_18570 [Flavobacterium sp.]|nr:MAG: hypothetical protein EOO47_18570 [Flavobacterium sp.]